MFGGWFGLRVRGCIRGVGACDTVKTRRDYRIRGLIEKRFVNIFEN